ncbi:uncharacterized protein [Melanerpes formicivorus]|uniref:uncharacterized protein isoform X2 n=1 Tax=Melanerpes formicivorus TaxID=211600 RepID=UPI00358E0EAA
MGGRGRRRQENCRRVGCRWDGRRRAEDCRDPYSGPILLDEELASRCGYVLSEDVWGNPVFRASVLGCHVVNEVSVKTDVASVSNDYTVAWMSALPETQNIAYQLWQLMCVSPSGRKRITVSDAAKLGYSFHNRLYQVYLWAPYHSNESDITTISFREPSGAQVDRTILGVTGILHSHQNQETSCLDSPHQSQEDLSERMCCSLSWVPPAMFTSCVQKSSPEGWTQEIM